MTLPPSLRAKAEAAAEEHALLPLPQSVFEAAEKFRNHSATDQTTEVVRVIERAAFNAGVHWLYQHLLSSGTEFEEGVCATAAQDFTANYQTINMRPPHRPDVMQYCFVKGARFQHAQMQAQIQAAHSEIECLRKQLAEARGDK